MTDFDTLSAYGVTLREIQEQDLPQLLTWRNRHDIRKVMKTSDEISASEHLSWFKSLATKTDRQYFSILYKDELIGSANISCEHGSVHSAELIEPGLYIGHEKYRGNILAFAPSLVLCDYCFNVIKAKKLLAIVSHQNEQAIAYNKKLGYSIEPSDNDDCAEQQWITMGLCKDDYEQSTKTIKSLLSRVRK